MTETFLVIILIFGVLYYTYRGIAKRGREMVNLASRGTTVTGKVIKTNRRRGAKANAACRVRYAFTTSGGEKIERELSVLSKEFHDFHEGQDIEIVYDPNNPKTNAMKSMVDAVRNASVKARTGEIR